jgi:hypothetical protein
MNWMKLRTPEQRKASAAKSVATRKKNTAERKAIELANMEMRDVLLCEIKKLKDKLASLERHDLVNKKSLSLSSKAMLTEEDIVNGSAPWTLSTGVYFLINDDKVVYVGQSVNVYARIASHHDKPFNKFAFIPCEPKVLDGLESLYIHVFRPLLNADHIHGAKHAPISLNKLMGKINA